MPLGWGWKAYAHEAGKPWDKGSAGRAVHNDTRCSSAPADLFKHFLRNAGMAVYGPLADDMRLATDAEIAAGIFVGGPNDKGSHTEQGELF
nr:hypothetical protein ISGA_610 [Gordonia sp. NB41Y]